MKLSSLMFAYVRLYPPFPPEIFPLSLAREMRLACGIMRFAFQQAAYFTGQPFKFQVSAFSFPLFPPTPRPPTSDLCSLLSQFLLLFCDPRCPVVPSSPISAFQRFIT